MEICIFLIYCATFLKKTISGQNFENKRVRIKDGSVIITSLWKNSEGFEFLVYNFVLYIQIKCKGFTVFN